MRRSPQRSRIGCRAVRDKRDLVRLVHTPEERFLLDLGGKMPGRGAYLCPNTACLDTAIKRKSFDRTFRRTVSREIVAALEVCLREHLAGRMGGPGGAPAGAADRDGG